MSRHNSFGQFIPGKSLMHKADPRTKILFTIAVMVLVLMCKTYIEYAIAGIFVVLFVILSKISIKTVLTSIKPVLFLLIFTIVFNILFYNGETVLYKIWRITIYRESIDFSLKMIMRVCFLVISASILTFTTSPVAITDGIEALLKPLAKIGFPAHEFAMMMSIALRFIPTFADETEIIIKAQKSRGADFESRNLFKAIKSYVPVLIPLFVGAFKSADDMATAMEARCYRGGEGRTKYKLLKFGNADLIVLILTFAFALLLITFKFFKFF